MIEGDGLIIVYIAFFVIFFLVGKMYGGPVKRKILGFFFTPEAEEENGKRIEIKTA